MKTNFSILSGKVSHLSTTSTVSGSVKRGKGDVNTSHKMDFRVDGQAAVFNSSVNIAVGDDVTLVGNIKRGELRVRALRNEETGVIYSEMTTLAYVIGSIGIIAGLIFAVFIIGIPIFVAGVWLIFEGRKNQAAINSLP
ncbi:MAG: hypothetical protein AB8B94_19730 [Hyphomicrobiales bacterium]